MMNPPEFWDKAVSPTYGPHVDMADCSTSGLIASNTGHVVQGLVRHAPVVSWRLGAWTLP